MPRPLFRASLPPYHFWFRRRRRAGFLQPVVDIDYHIDFRRNTLPLLLLILPHGIFAIIWNVFQYDIGLRRHCIFRISLKKAKSLRIDIDCRRIPLLSRSFQLSDGLPPSGSLLTPSNRLSSQQAVILFIRFSRIDTARRRASIIEAATGHIDFFASHIDDAAARRRRR